MAKKYSTHALAEYEDARIIKVTGYLVLKTNDDASRLALDDILQDMNDGMVQLNQLDELTVADMPNAVVTRSGIRTDTE
jgi:hypothetical protein